MYKLTLIIKEFKWQEGTRIEIHFKTFEELEKYVKTFKPEEYDVKKED